MTPPFCRPDAPKTLTIVADVTAGPCFVGFIPRTVVPEIQGLLSWEDPPGLGRTHGEVRGQVGGGCDDMGGAGDDMGGTWYDMGGAWEAVGGARERKLSGIGTTWGK